MILKLIPTVLLISIFLKTSYGDTDETRPTCTDSTNCRIWASHDERGLQSECFQLIELPHGLYDPG